MERAAYITTAAAWLLTIALVGVVLIAVDVSWTRSSFARVAVGILIGTGGLIWTSAYLSRHKTAHHLLKVALTFCPGLFTVAAGLIFVFLPFRATRIIGWCAAFAMVLFFIIHAGCLIAFQIGRTTHDNPPNDL